MSFLAAATTPSSPLDALFDNPWLVPTIVVCTWMLVDAVRHKEWFWAAFILLFPPLNAALYFFLVHQRRKDPAKATEGQNHADESASARMLELTEQIKSLDKAHHHQEFGTILLGQGRLKEALDSFHEAVRREPEDLDMQASLAQCLLRLNRPGEARVLLDNISRRDPNHSYGSTKMDLAEAHAALGERDKALVTWQEVLKSHSYPRARVRLAELYLALDQPLLARRELEEVLDGEKAEAGSGNRRDHVWIQRARHLMREMPSDTLAA